MRFARGLKVRRCILDMFLTWKMIPSIVIDSWLDRILYATATLVIRFPDFTFVPRSDLSKRPLRHCYILDTSRVELRGEYFGGCSIPGFGKVSIPLAFCRYKKKYRDAHVNVTNIFSRKIISEIVWLHLIYNHFRINFCHFCSFDLAWISLYASWHIYYFIICLVLHDAFVISIFYGLLF